MIGRRGPLGILVALCLGMVAACDAAIIPSPARPPSSLPSEPATTPFASHAASAQPSASNDGRYGLGAELDIQSLPLAVSGAILEFVSDGTGILYSSSRAPDSDDDAAPDLWRYEPGAAEPSLLWRNPDRAHSIVKIAGDHGTIAFVDMPTDGTRAWNLWLIPEPGADPILLDTHPGDEEVSSLVPSIAVYQPMVAWTAFDRGPSGPVSQLLVAAAPDWEPRVVQERLASQAELWLPSLYGGTMVFTEVRYAADHTTDERFVEFLDLGDPAAEPRRLDTSGRATMPLILDDIVLWKETEPGFNMFNWGEMVRYDLRTGEAGPISIHPQEAVNYPSIGERFAAWWGADAFEFGIYDVEKDQARQIQSYSTESQDNVVRPHVAGGLLVWMFVDNSAPDLPTELRYAQLPGAGTDRLEEDD